MYTRQKSLYIEVFVEFAKRDIVCIKNFRLKQPHPNVNKSERETIKNYPKGKISSLLTMIKEEESSLWTQQILLKKLSGN